MNSKPALRLDWCSHKAAKYAVEKWHYSRRLPLGPLVRVGVWEADRFVGCVLFGRGANPNLGKGYGLKLTEVCELVRVALTSHAAPVSRIVAIAIRFLTRANPGLRLIASYADPSEGHNGGIYQAGNWIYSGMSKPELQFFHAGRWKHHRLVLSRSTFGGQKNSLLSIHKSLKSRRAAAKHRYYMPLDDEVRGRVAAHAKPYPTRAGSIAADAPAHQAGEGGPTPTPALT